LNDETSCDCADVYEQDWTLIEPTMPAGDELTRLRAENALIRAALKPILARIEMPRNGCSHTQDVMIQASELEALQAALRSGDEKGLIR
jgi:hypothetical protein